MIIYHANYADGFCAAWLCDQIWPNDEYIPASYGDAPPDVTGKDVLILDFSYSRETMLALKSSAKSLRCLDHHKTAEEALQGLDFCTFDMGRSGAILTWDYLVEAGLLKDAALPWLVPFVQDRDLWLWKLPLSREINAALASYPMDFAVWDKLATTQTPVSMAIQGEGILRYQQQLAAIQASHAELAIIAGYIVPVVNCTALISETIGRLAVGQLFAAGWFEKDGDCVYSLRSAPDGLDVSVIAKSLGGGGHKHAAGFTISGRIG